LAANSPADFQTAQKPWAGVQLLPPPHAPFAAESNASYPTGADGLFLVGSFVCLEVAFAAAFFAFFALFGGGDTAFVFAGFAGVGGFFAAIGLVCQCGSAGQGQDEGEERDFGDEFHIFDVFASAELRFTYSLCWHGALLM
jgi:hypothetical protein